MTMLGLSCLKKHKPIATSMEDNQLAITLDCLAVKSEFTKIISDMTEVCDSLRALLVIQNTVKRHSVTPSVEDLLKDEFTDGISNESIADKIKKTITWIVEKAKELWAKFWSLFSSSEKKVDAKVALLTEAVKKMDPKKEPEAPKENKEISELATELIQVFNKMAEASNKEAYESLREKYHDMNKGASKHITDMSNAELRNACNDVIQLRRTIAAVRGKLRARQTKQEAALRNAVSASQSTRSLDAQADVEKLIDELDLIKMIFQDVSFTHAVLLDLTNACLTEVQKRGFNYKR